MIMTNFKQSNTYKELIAHHNSLKNHTLFELFQQNQAACIASCENFHFNFSKNHINQQTLMLLCNLAKELDLKKAIQDLFAGVAVNKSEHRPALHMALRGSTQYLKPSNTFIKTQIEEELKKVEMISDKINHHQWLGATKKPITDIVNIGIGGSHLGPEMVVTALKPFSKNIRCHFVSNVDSADISQTLSALSPETTLFIIASKTFTTQETLTNALTARAWLQAGLGESKPLDAHLIAISAAPEKAHAFGVKPEHVLSFWDWVGGRYSLWSAIGLPIAISIGMKHFRALLAGAYAMDQHFYSQPFENNIPVIAGLLTFWYRTFFARQTHAIIPYDHTLRLLPDYLQQLDMESLGKRVTQQGEVVDYSTGSILWGGIGTNGQHAFHQLLHQGTEWCPIDFILPLNNQYGHQDHEKKRIANCVAQAFALLKGKTDSAPEQCLPGGRPSNLISFSELTPYTLGQLIAFYEHRVYVQSVLWDINPFDQWGVEFGKALSQRVLQQWDSCVQTNAQLSQDELYKLQEALVRDFTS